MGHRGDTKSLAGLTCPATEFLTQSDGRDAAVGLGCRAIEEVAHPPGRDHFSRWPTSLRAGVGNLA